jgi:putative intracellular protease/amidase
MPQIAVVVYPGFTALDFIGPYEVLRNLPDAEVRFVWHRPGPVTADSGVLVVGATHSFDETPAPDILLVPGGMTSTEHARDQELLAWIRQAHETSSWTTSVCSGSLILAASGVLDGLRATSHWGVLPLLKTFGVTPVSDERVVRQGKVVTAAGVSAGIDLAMWLAGEIAGEAHAKATQLIIEYDPQPPFDSGHMSKASAATKAAALAALAKDTVLTHRQLGPSTLLLWDRALAAVRSRGRRGTRPAEVTAAAGPAPGSARRQSW